MKAAGTLVKWNDERGFGFVRTAGGDEVFVHVSAFPPDARYPEIGEALLFDIDTAPDGRLRASDVQRPGRTVRRQAAPPRRSGRPAPSRTTNYVVGFLIVVALAAYGWRSYQRAIAPVPVPLAAPVSAPHAMPLGEPQTAFRCDGRTHCSHMKSREEAEFFLENCPGMKMDGDHDGIPCESQEWP